MRKARREDYQYQLYWWSDGHPLSRFYSSEFAVKGWRGLGAGVHPFLSSLCGGAAEDFNTGLQTTGISLN